MTDRYMTDETIREAVREADRYNGWIHDTARAALEANPQETGR